MLVCFVLWHRHFCFRASHTLLYAICLECPEGLGKGARGRGGGDSGLPPWEALVMIAEKRNLFFSFLFFSRGGGGLTRLASLSVV